MLSFKLAAMIAKKMCVSFYLPQKHIGAKTSIRLKETRKSSLHKYDIGHHDIVPNSIL